MTQAVDQLHEVAFQELGLIDYKEAWDYQEKLFDELVSLKLRNRNLSEEDRLKAVHHLLFCEHPHVYTLGKSGSFSNMLLNEGELEKKDAVYYKINRGGDITYHGPGQLVGYPIFDLDYFFTDIHKYLRYLEESVILTLSDFGLRAGRIKGLTGVWMDPENPAKSRKICAMGVRCSRWVTMHGFAFNVNPDLSYFNHIVPCGITDKSVTSMQMELGKKQDMDAVKMRMKFHLSQLFNIIFTE
jgi:lipoyl(octanoyl) transferase